MENSKNTLTKILRSFNAETQCLTATTGAISIDSYDKTIRRTTFAIVIFR
jgi:hypothetical protein